MSHCIQNKSDIERDSKTRYLHVGTIYLAKCDKIRGKEKHRINTVMVSVWLDQTVQRHYNSYCFVCFLLLCECIWTYKKKRNITLHPSKAYFFTHFPVIMRFHLANNVKDFIYPKANQSQCVYTETHAAGDLWKHDLLPQISNWKITFYIFPHTLCKPVLSDFPCIVKAHL